MLIEDIVIKKNSLNWFADLKSHRDLHLSFLRPKIRYWPSKQNIYRICDPFYFDTSDKTEYFNNYVLLLPTKRLMKQSSDKIYNDCWRSFIIKFTYLALSVSENKVQELSSISFKYLVGLLTT